MLANELSAFLQATNDCIAFRQVIDLVSTGWMRFDRKNPAVDAEATDAIKADRADGAADLRGTVPAVPQGSG